MAEALDTFWTSPKKIISKISKEFRLAFLSACFIGVIIHLYAFSNLLINHDGIVSLWSENEHLASGRWALHFFSCFSGSYELPVVIGLLSILALAVSAGLTVRVLRLTHPVAIVLTAGLLVSFPVTACIFSYLFTADAYFIALLLTSLTAYVAQYIDAAGKRSTRLVLVLISAVCLAVSSGIYQAFIGYAVGLLLFDCILRLLERAPVRQVIKTGVRYLLIILLGLVLYVIVLQILLRVRHVELTTYRNMDQAFSFSPRAYLAAIPSIYRDFWRYFWYVQYFDGKWIAIPRLILICSATLGCTSLAACRREEAFPVRLFLVLSGVILTPLAVSFISVITRNTGIYELMQYSYILIYIFAVKLAELCGKSLIPEPFRAQRAVALVSLLLCGAFIWNSLCITNKVYLRMQICMENTTAWANRIVTQIEALPGYTPETPVAFVGSSSTYGKYNAFWGPDNFSSVSSVNHMNWYTGNTILYRLLSRRPAFLPSPLLGTVLAIFPHTALQTVFGIHCQMSFVNLGDAT